jgi:NADPH:quinone reductase-like Zn-dependent oxidoreductase
VRALGFTEHGDWKDLKVLEIPTPEPGPGEVRVRVAYAALNRLDLFVLKGWKGLELEMPHVGGSDVAGVVDKVGAGVDGWRPGDRVVLYPSTSCGRCDACRRGEVSLCQHHRLFGEHARGGFAEMLVAPAQNLRRVPDGFPLRDAAAASLVFLTAWRMLISRGRLRAGESVLVVGAAGGVNSAALQIAKLAGAAPVFATATTPRKADLARALGAERVFDAAGDWHKEVFAATGKRGVDVVVDNVGAATWGKSLRAVARGGRVVTVGGTTGYDPKAELNQVFWKQVSVIGSTMGDPHEFDAVMDLVFRGRLKAVVDEELPLDRGAEAYRRLAEAENLGKVLLRIDPRVV